MEYPQVKHAHIVLRAYLVNFADEQKRLTMRLVGSTDSTSVHLESIDRRRLEVQNRCASRRI
ncbi:MAG: hypothetical protein ACTHNB_13470 [Gaiellaceae bacterium]